MTASALPWRIPGFSRMALRDQSFTPAAAPAGRFQFLRDRDPNAWRQLFDQEMPAIYRYAISRLGDAGRAEDATSDVFEQAWKGADTLEDRGLPPRAWLFGIARNVVAGHHRSWFRRAPQVAIDAFEASGNDAGLSADSLDLVRSIAKLEPAHSEVINLRFIQGLSLQETADALGTTVDGVKGRQARALAVLREALAVRSV